MSKLKELKKSILANGLVNEHEVKQLREILYADGTIDMKEADFLFELNDAVSGKNNHPSWDLLFVEAITSFLLEDDVSPGEIDESEANWLLDKILGDGKLDDIEVALLNNLRLKSKSLPQILTNLL